MDRKELDQVIDKMILDGLLVEVYDPNRKEMVLQVTEKGKALSKLQ